MANGWGLAQYKGVPGKPQARYCAIEDHRDAILADGGTYSYREILGNTAVVAIKGVTAATLQAIVSDPVIRRFPAVAQLTDNLGVLTNAQWASYRQFAIDLGYPAAEWDAVFGGAGQQGNFTLRDVVVFVARRRITERFDVATQAIVLDGAVIPLPASTADTVDSGT